MQNAKVDIPPLILASRSATLVVVALSVHGSMCRAEISHVTTLSGPRLSRVLHQLKQALIVIDCHRRGNRSENLKSGVKMWSLDRRHPLFVLMRNLGKSLARNFPTPHNSTIGRKRRHQDSKGPTYQLSAQKLNILGATGFAKIMLLLSWAHNVPTRKITTLLGRGSAMYKSLRLLERYHIIKRHWQGSEHCVSLDENFCAHWSLVAIAKAVDRGTGSHYKSLAHARCADLGRKRLIAYSKRRARNARKRRRAIQKRNTAP